jgi:dUTP pyrophosphatase
MFPHQATSASGHAIPHLTSSITDNTPNGPAVIHHTGYTIAYTTSGHTATHTSNPVAIPHNDSVVTTTDNHTVHTINGLPAHHTGSISAIPHNDHVVTTTNSQAVHTPNGTTIDTTSSFHASMSPIPSNDHTIADPDQQSMDLLICMINDLSDKIRRLAQSAPRPHTTPEAPPHRYQPTPPNPHQYHSVPPNPYQYQSVPPYPYQYRPCTLNWRRDQCQVAQNTTYQRSIYDYAPQDNRSMYNEYANQRQSNTLDRSASYTSPPQMTYQVFDQPTKYHMPNDSYVAPTDHKSMTSRYALPTQVEARKPLPIPPARKRESETVAEPSDNVCNQPHDLANVPQTTSIGCNSSADVSNTTEVKTITSQWTQMDAACEGPNPATVAPMHRQCVRKAVHLVPSSVQDRSPQHIYGLINNVRVPIILGSGAPCSLISNKLAQELRILTNSHAQTIAHDLGSPKMTVKQTPEVELTIGDCTFTMRVQVCQDEQANMLLGNDFIMTTNAYVIPDQKRLFFTIKGQQYSTVTFTSMTKELILEAKNEVEATPSDPEEAKAMIDDDDDNDNGYEECKVALLDETVAPPLVKQAVAVDQLKPVFQTIQQTATVELSAHQPALTTVHELYVGVDDEITSHQRSEMPTGIALGRPPDACGKISHKSEPTDEHQTRNIDSSCAYRHEAHSSTLFLTPAHPLINDDGGKEEDSVIRLDETATMSPTKQVMTVDLTEPVAKIAQLITTTQPSILMSISVVDPDFYRNVDAPILLHQRVEAPDGIAPRSGLAVRYAIDVHAGVIDPDYTGEVIGALQNHGDLPLQIKAGERFAQLIIEKCEFVEVQEVKELTATARGAAGFGSTGRAAL